MKQQNLAVKTRETSGKGVARKLRSAGKVPAVFYGKKSEVLSSKWASKYDKNKFELQIGTNVSYSKFVQGPKGTQAKALTKIGWKGIDVVATEEKKKVAKYVFDAVKRAIDAA